MPKVAVATAGMLTWYATLVETPLSSKIPVTCEEFVGISMKRRRGLTRISQE
jgi:hypothetical protein